MISPGYRDMLVKTRSIPDGTKIWFDIRPNSNYPTLEFRICDVCTRVDEAVCIAAIFQALDLQDLETAPRQHDLPYLSIA